MKKLYSFLPLVILLLALFAGIVVFQGEGVIENFEKENNFHLSIGGAVFNIEIADTTKRRQQGLSGRESLAFDSGMLFVFEREDIHGIWMKDMQFPIDIIWLDEEFVVVDIVSNVSQESFPKIFQPHALALYVLELKAGTVERMGITTGDKMQGTMFGG